MTSASPPSPSLVSFSRPSVLARVLRARELPILVVIVLVCLAAEMVNHNFLSRGNIKSIILYSPLLIIVAMGEMMVIVTGGVDVSVGSMMGLAGMAVGLMFSNHWFSSVLLGAVVAAGLGGLLGAVNGVLVAFCEVPPIVATLGTLGAYRGLVHIISQGKQINADQLPLALDHISIDGPWGDRSFLPWLVYIAAAAAVATFAFLRYARTGRDIYALGGNPNAARLRGVPVPMINMLVYVLAGMGAGLAGILYASRFGTINPGNIGSGFELVVISAVVVGGVSIFGGTGSVLGVVGGCILLGTIYTALTALDVSPGWQSTAYGAAILLAVIFDDAILHRLARGSRRRAKGAA